MIFDRLFIIGNNVYFIADESDTENNSSADYLLHIVKSEADTNETLKYFRDYGYILYEHKNNGIITIVAMIIENEQVDSLVKICITVPSDIDNIGGMSINSIHDIANIEANYILKFTACADKVTETDIHNMKDGDLILAKFLLCKLRGNIN